MTEVAAERKTYVPRVTQLDSVQLDKEILQILKAQVANIIKFSDGNFVVKWGPEIEALLKFCIWKFSVNLASSTFGQQLLNLKYEGSLSKYKSYLLIGLLIFPKYIKDRLENPFKVFEEVTIPSKVQKTVYWAQTCFKIANLYNAVVFLKTGQYPTLIERILRLQLEPASYQPRSLGYNIMTRELIWHSLIELLGILLPMINYHYLRRTFLNLFFKSGSHVSKTLSFTGRTKCGVCGDTPVNPHHLGCSHVFCYYCLQGNLLADPGFKCPICGFSSENNTANRIVNPSTL